MACNNIFKEIKNTDLRIGNTHITCVKFKYIFVFLYNNYNNITELEYFVANTFSNSDTMQCCLMWIYDSFMMTGSACHSVP